MILCMSVENEGRFINAIIYANVHKYNVNKRLLALVSAWFLDVFAEY